MHTVASASHMYKECMVQVLPTPASSSTPTVQLAATANSVYTPEL